MTGLELTIPNPDKSEVMSRAAELRDEGFDKSDALSLAWEDILGEDYGLDEDDEELEVDELLPQSRRRSNPSESADTMGIGAMLLIGSVGYFLWCAFKYSQTKVWSWQPWKTIPISRRITAPRPQRPQTDIIVGGINRVETIYRARDSGEESIHLITP